MAATARSLRIFIGFVLLALTGAFAYVPAQPTNSSKEAIAGGLNVTDVSKLYLRRYSNNNYSQSVSYQLAGNASHGISKGALVHFSEAKVTNETQPTTTPWIAMVSCDFNATNASQEDDVFTLARDKGAVAALLYSLYSLACVINPEYTDPATFDQVFDIFSTQNLTSAHLIEDQFDKLGTTNESIYGIYDSRRLNDSASFINSTISLGSPPAPGYIFAILQAYNATAQIDDPPEGGVNTVGTESPQGGHSSKTALAMIVLYVITGCVSALFCVIIVSGAIRAIRYPDRYGPRARNGRGFGQSRAQGLTRAILDTFPIVKFGDNSAQSDAANTKPSKDVEGYGLSTSPATELREWEVVVGTQGRDNLSRPISLVSATRDEFVVSDAIQRTPIPGHLDQNRSLAQQNYPKITDSDDVPRDGPSRRTPSVKHQNDVVPASMGRETCPICIMDFEEGDDLRLLPCEGKHRFHQTCVDPWLLELSSSCPICRQDFLALENILSGESEQNHHQDHENDPEQPTRATPPTVSGNRFSRYLRFAKRRHHRSHGEDEFDPTDPYMPPTSDPSMYTSRQNMS